MKETFGQRIQRLRKNLNLKQDDIANKLNVTPQAVSKWENDISAPDFQTLPLLADILRVSLDELLGRDIPKTTIMPENNRKDINNLLLKITIESNNNDKVKINIPISLIKICLDAGLDLPKVNGKDTLKNIDFNQIFSLIEAGVIGRLIEIESADGDTIYVTVE